MTVLPAATVGRMLIGDDENLIRSLIRKVFEAEGWEVDEASDFDEVLSSTREQPAGFDVIVLDLSMNGPPAETVVDSIIESHPDAKILMISGFGRDSRVENLLQKTGGQFVSKPFSPKDLLSRVDELIAGS
jgi:DNA-binding response OmpR family regulator